MLAFIDRKPRDVPGDGIGGRDSGEGHVRGLIDRRNVRGGSPRVQSPLPTLGLDRERWLADSTIDIDKHSSQNPVVFSMPKRDSETIKQRKRKWYQRNKDEILKRARERRAAKKKHQPPRPISPAPTPGQIAKRRELNNQACHRYWATHLTQVRYINRVYYHRDRDRIVQQQRNRRTMAKQNKQNPDPFRKLRALADVCSARLIELDHGYTREKEEAGPPKKCGKPKAVSRTSGRRRHRVGEGP